MTMPHLGGAGDLPRYHPPVAATTTMQYAEALLEALLRDDRVFAMGEGVGGLQHSVFNVTQGLQKQFGEWRAIGNPLSEAAIAGAGVGAAVFGRHPVPEIMFNNLLALVALSA